MNDDGRDAMATAGGDAAGSLLSRRRFLAGVAGVVLSPVIAASDVLGASPGRRGAAASPGPIRRRSDPLPIGYIVGSDAWPDLEDASLVRSQAVRLGRVVPVTALPRRPAGVPGAVRITVHGLCPEPAALSDRSFPSVEFDVELGPRGGVPYHAWSARGGRAPFVSQRSSFEAHLVPNAPVTFALTRTFRAGRRTLRQSFGRRGLGITPLRHGAYLIALDGDTRVPSVRPGRGSIGRGRLPALPVLLVTVADATPGAATA